MKLLPLFALAALSAALPLHADITIVQDIQQGGGPKAVDMTVTTMLKGTIVRVDINPQMSALHDLTTGDTTSLIHPQKLAMKIPAAMLEKLKAARQQQPADASDATPQLVDTGNKDTINGFACEEYDTSVKGMKIQMWLTKDAPEAEKAMKEMKTMSDGMDPLGGALDKQEMPGFPVRTVANLPDGSVLTSTVVTLNTDTLPDSDFTVPSDYKTMAAPTQPGM